MRPVVQRSLGRADEGSDPAERPRQADAKLAAYVRQFIVMQLGSGRCTIDQAAAHLGIDRRTVHRRLAREGETFTSIVDHVRRELATRYIREGARSLAEISGLLGFAAQSGFSRWYRRTFGRPASHERVRTEA